MLELCFMALFWVFGAGWMYAHCRRKYHLGCAAFLDECAELIEHDQFNEGTVLITFHKLMPWQS